MPVKLTVVIADEDVAGYREVIARAIGKPEGELASRAEAEAFVSRYLKRTYENVKRSQAERAAIAAVPEVVIPPVVSEQDPELDLDAVVSPQLPEEGP